MQADLRDAAALRDALHVKKSLSETGDFLSPRSISES
jgi:hypothetical protein